MLGFSDAQVRKDLAYFGHFGHPGVGYRCDELVSAIRRILGTDRDWPIAMIGTGNLGRKGVHWEGDFTIGQWHQLAMHIHWSEDPNKGNAKLWWEGVVVLDKKVQTKGPESVYFCQPGIHRDPHSKSVDTIYFDDFICATTQEEIEIRKPTATKSK